MKLKQPRNYNGDSCHSLLHIYSWYPQVLLLDIISGKEGKYIGYITSFYLLKNKQKSNKYQQERQMSDYGETATTSKDDK